MLVRKGNIVYLVKVDGQVKAVCETPVGAGTYVQNFYGNVLAGRDEDDVPQSRDSGWCIEAWDTAGGMIGAVAKWTQINMVDLMRLESMTDNYILSGKLRGHTDL